ncbi:hypothetical protein C0992_003466, partial [Termitomyces sp. T32_za158]
MVRLESESRTLAKRMSAVSLASQEDHYISMHTDLATATTYINARDTPASPFLQSNASVMRNQYQKSVPRTGLDRIPTNSRPNGVNPSKRKISSPTPGSVSHFQRSRTYSQPYLSDVAYGTTSRSKTKGSPPGNDKPMRTLDARPTRIPQPAGRSPPLSISTNGSNKDRVLSSPVTNGHHVTSTPTTPVSHSALTENGRRTPTSIPRPALAVDVNTNVGLGLLNEPPPFDPASASSSKAPSQRSASPDIRPPRPSTESEERPFEHRYRGEVSRNGGVGELRVGRRQEMLDIANYGHTIRARERERREGAKRRKRADSGSWIADGSRERESLHLDDEDVGRVGRVLDEAPLTDLDGSEGGHYIDDGEVYGHGVHDEDEDEHTWRQDDSTFDEGLSRATLNGTTSPQHETSWTSHGTHNSPSPTTIQSKRPDAATRPSKIPARSRQSSESRGATPTPVIRGASEPPTPSSSHTPPPQSRQRSQQQPKATPNKRAASKPRTPAGKSRAKTVASKKDLDEEAKRRSIARYPTPGNGNDEMMIDAIPEWTQPVPHQGNWDDVILPVVARKKGLDEHYQKADGNPAPRMVATTPAPAPGTFAFDDSKYRRTRGDAEPESIPMDEFGQSGPQVSIPQVEEEKPSAPSLYQTYVDNHDQTRLPARTAPSPAPFSDYPPGPSTKINAPAPITTTADLEKRPKITQQQPDDRDEEGGGCC